MRALEEEAVRSLKKMTGALTRAERHMTKSKECVLMKVSSLGVTKSFRPTNKQSHFHAFLLLRIGLFL